MNGTAKKAVENLQKHRVSFEEAKSAFDDENAVEFIDDVHSISEVRFKLIGASPSRLLFVVFTERLGVCRIISAREAIASEIEIYYEFKKD